MEEERERNRRVAMARSTPADLLEIARKMGHKFHGQGSMAKEEGKDSIGEVDGE